MRGIDSQPNVNSNFPHYRLPIRWRHPGLYSRLAMQMFHYGTVQAMRFHQVSLSGLVLEYSKNLCQSAMQML
jgi:hypothetical protein